MEKSKEKFNYDEFIQELTCQFDSLFESALRGNERISGLLTTEDIGVKKILQGNSKKISSIQRKISNILEIFANEKDEKEFEKDSIDINKEISDILAYIEKKIPGKKTVLETNLAPGLPLVSVNRKLFRKWFFWCIARLYRIAAVTHISAETFDDSGRVRLVIRPVQTSDTIGDVWKGIDWLCAERYFNTDRGQVKVSKDKGLSVIFGPLEKGSNGKEGIVDARHEGAKSIINKIRKGIDLPTLSPVATRIINMAIDDETSAREIAGVITVDPALTAKLLRVVNSPLYGLRKEITTLHQAISLLGMKAVRTLSLSISLVNTFPKKNSGGFNFDKFWEQSIASAIASKITAQKLKSEFFEEAFICGLTHNIGSLVLANFYPDEYGRIIDQHYNKGEDLISLEMELWDVNHAMVGYEAFTRWEMPKIFAETVLYHHEPEKVRNGNSQLELLTKIVYLSELVSQVFFEKDQGSHLDELKEAYKKLVDLDESNVDEIMMHVSNEILVVAKDFELEATQPADYAEILQSAVKKLELLNLDYEHMNRELTTAKEKAEGLTAQLRQAAKKLTEQATKDGLTGLYNHRFFYDMAVKEFSKAVRHKQPLCCLMIDLDLFKKVNDTYGHREGDKILRHAGKLFKSALRNGDIAARYGGEEFALLLPMTSLKEGAKAAERIRKTFEETQFTEKITKGKITISIGVSCLQKKNFKSHRDFIVAADKALYRAKHSGRNRVES
ncbi:HDOD domain-containing protein [Thermodesulfobacteriota bacterium]